MRSERVGGVVDWAEAVTDSMKSITNMCPKELHIDTFPLTPALSLGERGKLLHAL